MKRWITTALAMLFTLALPFGALAMDQQGGSMNGMGQSSGSMQGMEQGGMMMLGNKTEDGVTAMAHIKDIREGMSKMGMSQTHHFMVMFTDTASGKSTGGIVAVKIKDPSGNLGKPIQLMGMKMDDGEGYGSDITLPEKGHYQFIIGSKLQDGKRRQFQFGFDYK